MLIEYRLQNSLSFNAEQTFSMLASTNNKENLDNTNTIEVNKTSVKQLVKSAAIFGANGSGKSNLIVSIGQFRSIVLDSLKTLESPASPLTMPFFIKENYYDIPTEFEVTFLCNKIIYRYGLSMNDSEILEEWLYWTKNTRETMLFHRQEQCIEYNQRSFPEAKAFTKIVDGELQVDKTKAFVPFISVLSQFDGEISNSVISWFRNVKVISGTSKNMGESYTTTLFEEDPEFRTWALKILASLQIEDIKNVEVEQTLDLPSNVTDKELNEVVEKLELFLKKTKLKEKKLEVIRKNPNTGKLFSLPLKLESDGTIKLINLLGPLYDIIKQKKIVFIDEFDNRFHTLLSKFIIQIYQKNNTSESQLIISCHDTNLLNKEIFRRDQIWFVEKNENHESELYSLLEYKDLYSKRDDSYSKNYLAGKYGAIPLFSSVDQLIACHIDD